MRKSTATWGLLVISLAFVACTKRQPNDDQRSLTPKPLIVQFGWAFDAHHLGFIAADKLGYYRETGLAVSLVPGGFDSSPVRTLASGGAQVAQISGVEQLLAARAEGLPVRAVAAFHRTSPHALISLSKRPIRSAEDAKGKTIAVAFGDSAEFLLRDFLNAGTSEPSDVKFVPFRFDITPLLRGDVDAITGFATDQPHTIRAKNQIPTVLRYGEARQVGYGYMFLVRDGNDKGIRSFVEASRKGWKWVFTRPEESLDILLKAFPNLDRGVEQTKLESVRQLMVTQDGKLDNWCMDAAVLETVHSRMTKYHQLRSPIDVVASFTNEYCRE